MAEKKTIRYLIVPGEGKCEITGEDHRYWYCGAENHLKIRQWPVAVEEAAEQKKAAPSAPKKKAKAKKAAEPKPKVEQTAAEPQDEAKEAEADG